MSGLANRSKAWNLVRGRIILMIWLQRILLMVLVLLMIGGSLVGYASRSVILAVVIDFVPFLALVFIARTDMTQFVIFWMRSVVLVRGMDYYEGLFVDAFTFSVIFHPESLERSDPDRRTYELVVRFKNSDQRLSAIWDRAISRNPYFD